MKERKDEEKMRKGDEEKEAGKTCQSAPKVLLAESEGVKNSEKMKK